MPTALGFDSSVLSPFARAGQLDALEHITAGHRRVVPRAVLDELSRGAEPALHAVHALPWLARVAVDSLAELGAFAAYVRVLGEAGRNIGESSVLAWVEVNGGVGVVDDQAAVSAARARGVAVRRSLALVADALHRRRLAAAEARGLVDALIARGGARYPCDGAGFEAWAEQNGLLPAPSPDAAAPLPAAAP